ncbi:MAG: histidine kinase dimerization/phosphoacceptor domain -containing protein [Candidatus Latescibacterota bacterium]
MSEEELRARLAQLEQTVALLQEELQRTSSELLQLTLEMEDRVAARTAELERSKAHLEAQVAQRWKAEARTTRALREKETLLKEVHHRVKNNLQLIASLLRMQARRLGKGEAQEVFLDSQGRVQSMALIHERLYRSEARPYVDFGPYLRHLTSDLACVHPARGQPIGIVVEAEGVELDLDVAVPCGLIVNELVTNALKHAFPDPRGGTIRVSLGWSGDRWALGVEDDGVGGAGQGEGQEETLGLRLVRILSEQLHGSVCVCSGAGGTRTVVSFPGVPRQK